MAGATRKGVMRRRKEVALFLCAVVASGLIAWRYASGWLGEESWGEAISARQVDASARPAGSVIPDFANLWEAGGRNPFGDAAVALESGGKAKIPLPFPPPVTPELPPAPMVTALDLLMGGGK